MNRRYIPSPNTRLNIVSVLLLIAPAVFFAADQWIWAVPHGYRFHVFQAGWWTAELAALASIPFAIAGRGLPRFSMALLGFFEMWLISRWFNIA
ncbi:hypothetical protein [Tunturiibacter lichenicola]|uniref:hypothetical protein n=1 Tax=Tunturiibacter lichenicola TaxID=2051959 RepID=UPI003D9B250B